MSVSSDEHLKHKSGQGTMTCSDLDEKSCNVCPAASRDCESPDGLTEISYPYLTFETLLPPLCCDFSRETQSPTSIPPPPPPDLKKFESPFEWSSSRKQFIVWLSTIATVTPAYTAGAFSPPAVQMAAYWHVSELAILVGITTFCCGFAISPMVLAPFSEINGRYPVFLVAGVVFFFCQLSCALTRSYAGMLVARFFVGCGSSVFSTMVGGVISDIYHAENRNTPMAIYSGGVFFGTGLGPLVSGFIAQNTSWRWVFWVQVITNGILVTAVALTFRETRGNILLSRKARCLNRWYEECEAMGYFGVEMPTEESGTEKKIIQRIRWKVKSDEERESLSKMIGIAVYRPFHLLITEPVVFFFSLWVSFSWAVLYLTFGSIPLVFERSHGFSLEHANAVFAAMSVAAILITSVAINQDKILARYLERSRRGTTPQSRLLQSLDLASPEARLYFACIESSLLPIGLFWSGWTQFSSIPWIVPVLGISCATMGIYSIYLATFNYLADSYHRYASSALAAQSFCRNVMGGIFPLITPALFKNLTFQGASSLLGGIAALLTIVPWVLVFYGPKIRARSKFASALA